MVGTGMKECVRQSERERERMMDGENAKSGDGDMREAMWIGRKVIGMSWLNRAADSAD